MPSGVIIGLVFLVLTIWTVALYIEYLFLHGRYGGRLKRGIKVWSEPVSEDVKHYLQRLPDDIVDYETGAFIRKEQNVVLIQPYNIKRARRWWWLRHSSSSFYIGYIDLRVKEPRIQYRAPALSFTSGFTLLTGFLVAAFMETFATFAEEASFQGILILSFVTLILGLICYFGHVIQRDRVLRFVKKKMRSSQQAGSRSQTELQRLHRIR